MWLVLLLKHTLGGIMRILESVDDAQVPPIGNVLEGRHFFAVAFPGVGTMAWLVLSLKHALRNIIYILQALVRG